MRLCLARLLSQLLTPVTYSPLHLTPHPVLKRNLQFLPLLSFIASCYIGLFCSRSCLNPSGFSPTPTSLLTFPTPIPPQSPSHLTPIPSPPHFRHLTPALSSPFPITTPPTLTSSIPHPMHRSPRLYTLQITHPCLTKSSPNPCPHQVATCLQLLSNDTDVDVVYFACLVCTLYHRYLTCD